MLRSHLNLTRVTLKVLQYVFALASSHPIVIDLSYEWLESSYAGVVHVLCDRSSFVDIIILASCL